MDKGHRHRVNDRDDALRRKGQKEVELAKLETEVSKKVCARPK